MVTYVRVAILAPITHRTPPCRYGPWGHTIALLTDGLVNRGVDVTLFATQDTITKAKLRAVCPHGYEENRIFEPATWEALHTSILFESANTFDIIHNHHGCMPLAYTKLIPTPIITTLLGYPTPGATMVYKRFHNLTDLVAPSEADKHPNLEYRATIYPAIDFNLFAFQHNRGEYLVYSGPLHARQGTKECIDIAHKTGMRLVMEGFIRDQKYFDERIAPYLTDRIIYVGLLTPVERSKLLGEAYALLYPVNDEESFCFSVVEAMACGTPVLAPHAGRMPELVSEGRTGYLVTCMEEMVDLLPAITRLDRRVCRQWIAERFSPERMVDTYLQVYRAILDKTKREDHRPWGWYEVLSDETDHKVKRINVYPGSRLSYQRHSRRTEHWYIVRGHATVTLNGQYVHLGPNEAIDLPQGAWHRIQNSGAENLVFIEIQTGAYFGEDDIERSEDDYGRT